MCRSVTVSSPCAATKTHTDGSLWTAFSSFSPHPLTHTQTPHTHTPTTHQTWLGEANQARPKPSRRGLPRRGCVAVPADSQACGRPTNATPCRSCGRKRMGLPPPNRTQGKTGTQGMQATNKRNREQTTGNTESEHTRQKYGRHDNKNRGGGNTNTLTSGFNFETTSSVCDVSLACSCAMVGTTDSASVKQESIHECHVSHGSGTRLRIDLDSGRNHLEWLIGGGLFRDPALTASTKSELDLISSLPQKKNRSTPPTKNGPQQHVSRSRRWKDVISCENPSMSRKWAHQNPFLSAN